MKKLVLLFSLLFVVFLSFSQESVNNELPYSWSNQVRSNIIPIVLEPLNFSQIIAEDAINDLDKSQPWRYGVTRNIEIDGTNSGDWIDLPNGGRLLQVAIKSPNAINLSVNFNEFYLPEGARLYLFNGDRTDVSKTYTNAENRENNQLGSWFVNGDVIWIEYYEPAEIAQQPKIKIGSVIHGYRMGLINQFIDGRGLNDSGECNYDVNCPIGEDFDDKKDILKKTVALLNLGNGYLCSATLINNTLQDKTPYLLTANHCLELSDPSFWSVRFNWMSPNPVCGTGEESSDLETNFTMSGAIIKASNELSDFALVELFNKIPNSWDLVFSGWDKSDQDPVFEVGIHHPNGDIMKVCRDDSGAVKEDAAGTQVWLIEGVSAGNGNGWEIGTTESGSSGSPLFDQDGKLIGQLYAGQSFCNGIENNGDYDIYGRFGVSWDSGSNPETRLKDWLDPNNSGVNTIEMLQNTLSIQDFELEGQLDIYPNPASTVVNVMNNRYPNLSYALYNVTGQQLKGGNLSSTINTINIEAYQNGVYFLFLKDEDTGKDITKRIVVQK